MRIYNKEQVSIAVDVYKQSLQYFNEMQHVWDDAKRMELLEQYVSLRNENIVFAAMAQAMAEVLGITSEQ
jgi:7-cyano-7-deazaguanine synthase in queuosine biosynthesis